MIRIGAAQLTYRSGERSAARTVAISREALALVAQSAPRSSAGYVSRLTVEVRVSRNASDRAVAQRIATAMTRRL